MKQLAHALADAIARWVEGYPQDAGNPTPSADAAHSTADALAKEIIVGFDGSPIARAAKVIALEWLSDAPRDDAGLAARLRMIAA